MIFIRAFQLARDFKCLSSKAKAMAISCLVKQHSLSYFLGTKESLKHPAESHELALKFVADARKTFTGTNRHHNFILNMDQTTISFCFHGKESLDSWSTCNVDICKSRSNTRHATLAVAVSFWYNAPHFLTFKEMPGGQNM